MARTASRRLHVIVGTALGATAVGSSPRSAAAKDGYFWNSSYLSRGLQDTSVIADRATMNKLYVGDVRRLRDTIPGCPRHTPLAMQASYVRGGPARLRVLTWNINILCGPDGSASVGGLQRIDPDLVADIIKEVNADIICLQEALDWIPPQFSDYLEKQGVGELDGRMRRLNARLREQGFTSMLRSCAPPSPGNPTLFASRLPVLHEETIDLALVQARANGMASPRHAAYVEVAVGERGNASVGVYATHLHHINYAPKEGQRLAEIQSLLQHAALRRQNPHRIGTIVTGDFNQARKQDYSSDEWSVVAAGLSKVQQPEDDGVFSALHDAGFRCSYDASSQDTNFGPRNSPAFTHWTGTTVDFLYSLQESSSCRKAEDDQATSLAVVGNYVMFSDLSDHLPVVTDLEVVLPSTSAQ